MRTTDHITTLKTSIMPRTIIALGLLLLAAYPAMAQEPDSAAGRPDTIPLPAVVVTATRLPLDRKALPTPVTVLSGRELRDRGVRTVADALRAVPGATVVRSGGTGSQTSVFLRGGESDYVQVLVDGVPINDPGGSVDFAGLSTDQVERIEVVRGPVSVLYGTDAVSGVIHIMTRRGSGRPVVSAEAIAGSGRQTHGGDRYGTYDLEAAVTGSAAALSYSLGAGREHSGGLYPLNNQHDLTTGTLRLGWTPLPGADVVVSSRISDGRSHFPTDGAGALVDENAYLDRRLWTSSVEAGWSLGDRVDARVQAGLVVRDQASVDEQDGPSDTDGVFASTLEFRGTRSLLDARVNARLLRSTLTGGIAWESADASTSYTSQSALGSFDASAPFDRSTTAYYLQLLSAPVSGLHLTLGGRIDDSETYGAFATYRIGAALTLLRGTRARAAIGRGFREPTFAESFGSGFGDLGNRGLEPERSRSREVGLEQEVGPATLAATWFDQRFDGLIQYTFSPPAAGDPNYYNVGAARSRGLELEARAARGRWSGAVSYVYLETEVLDPGLASDASFSQGEELIRRPAHSGSLTSRYAIHRASLAVSLNAVGERPDVDYGADFPYPRVSLPAYTTLDLAAEYQVPMAGPETRLLLRVENLLDAGYQAIAGFPGQRRVIYVGARVRAQ